MAYRRGVMKNASWPIVNDVGENVTNIVYTYIHIYVYTYIHIYELRYVTNGGTVCVVGYQGIALPTPTATTYSTSKTRI